MGKDKAFLDFKNKSLIRYQYDRLSAIFDKVYISTKKKDFGFDASLIFDSSLVFAPTPAFLDIFKMVDEFFAISVDTPFISEKSIRKIIETSKKNPKKDAVVAKTSFTHPLVGVYRKSILKNIENEIKKENFKLNYILKISDTLFVDFEDEEEFFNINYPKDYEKALLKSTDISQSSKE